MYRCLNFEASDCKAVVINKMDKRWMEHSKEEQLRYLSLKVEDCKFLVGLKGKEEPKICKGYKEILSSVSPVFERMFNGDFKEAKTNDPVAVDDAYFEDFQQFLAFVHCEDAFVKNWKEAYAIAKKYLADEIVERIISVLTTNGTTPYEGLCLFQIMHSEGKEISQNFWTQRVGSYVRKAMLEKAIEMPCIHCLNPEVFLQLMKSLKTSKTNIFWFIAISNYCAKEDIFSSSTEKFGYIALYFNELDFKQISIKDFLEFIEPSDLLDLEKKHKILLDICRKH